MTAEPECGPEITEDRLLDGRVRLLQPRRGHRAGTDAVLLASAADIRPGDHVLDLGSASGAVGLMAAIRVPGTRLGLVERDPDLVALARRNIALNNLTDRACAHEADLFAGPAAFQDADLVAGMGDVVLTNPPFFTPGGRPSPEPGRRAAHVLAGGDLDRWVAAAAWLLKSRGRIAMIHRADALGTCLDALRGAFGSIVIVPVYSKPGGTASRLILSAVKGGRAPLQIMRPLEVSGVAVGGDTKTAPAGSLPRP